MNQKNKILKFLKEKEVDFTDEEMANYIQERLKKNVPLK